MKTVLFVGPRASGKSIAARLVQKLVDRVVIVDDNNPEQLIPEGAEMVIRTTNEEVQDDSGFDRVVSFPLY